MQKFNMCDTYRSVLWMSSYLCISKHKHIRSDVEYRYFANKCK